MPYQWRSLTEAERRKLLETRQRDQRPWHSPPHFGHGSDARRTYLLTAACYEHTPLIGASIERMATFADALRHVLKGITIYAFCVPPNHYHVLAQITDLRATTRQLGQLHGKTSYLWNGEDNHRGRKVWHRASDRRIRSSDHFWATINYVHHNPVKHGYVEKASDWPFSSIHSFLDEMGRDRAVQLWREFPLLDYGRGWDD